MWAFSPAFPSETGGAALYLGVFLFLKILTATFLVGWYAGVPPPPHFGAKLGLKKIRHFDGLLWAQS